MPETRYLHPDRPEDLAVAAAILKAGGVVGFPTETVYGLGANALSSEAVKRIFVAKQRPAWDPLIVHVADSMQLDALVQLNGELKERVRVLSGAFWPGPLTLLLPRSSAVPGEVTAGRVTVGIRVPAHPVARALLRASGLPLAAPSANRFGHVSPTTAQHVLDDLDGRIDAVLDGGPTSVGVESTVLDPAPTPMRVYRVGAVTPEMLSAATGLAVEVFRPPVPAASEPPESLPSPGVGIRHYAPEARVILSGPSAAALQDEITRAAAQSDKVGVLLPENWQLEDIQAVEIVPWGRWEDPASLAAGLFSGLRALEKRGVAVICCPLPEPGGVREALRDRLTKAARPR